MGSIQKLFEDSYQLLKLLNQYEQILYNADFLIGIPLLDMNKENMEDNIEQAYIQAVTAHQNYSEIKQIVSNIEQMIFFNKRSKQILEQMIDVAPEEDRVELLGFKGTIDFIESKLEGYLKRAEKLLNQAQLNEENAVKIFADAIIELGQEEPSSKQVDITGTWNTNYGKFFFIQDGDEVRGFYPYTLGGMIGEMQGNILKATWIEGDLMGNDIGRVEALVGGEYLLGYGFSKDGLKQYDWYGIKESDEVAPAIILGLGDI